MFVANRKLVFQYLKEPSVIVENRITLQQKVGENLITICCQIFPHHASIPSLLPLLSITLYFYCKENGFFRQSYSFPLLKWSRLGLEDFGFHRHDLEFNIIHLILGVDFDY